jgi:uncharacterized protein with PQ loop repeat
MGNTFFVTLGIVAAIAMPLFNIPLIIKMIKRKSSRDISLVWVSGVWVMALMMMPSGLLSNDAVLKVFNITNFLLFTCVLIVTYIYRNGQAIE